MTIEQFKVALEKIFDAHIDDLLLIKPQDKLEYWILINGSYEDRKEGLIRKSGIEVWTYNYLKGVGYYSIEMGKYAFLDDLSEVFCLLSYYLMKK